MTWYLTAILGLSMGLAIGWFVRRRISSHQISESDDLLARVNRLFNALDCGSDCSRYLNKFFLETALRISHAHAILLLEDSDKSRRNYGLPAGLTARAHVLIAMYRNRDTIAEIDAWRDMVLEWEWPETTRKTQSNSLSTAAWIADCRAVPQNGNLQNPHELTGLWMIPINSSTSLPKWLAVAGHRSRLEKDLPRLDKLCREHLTNDGTFRKSFGVLKIGQQTFENLKQPLAMVVSDHIVQVNQSFEDLTGFDRNMLIGKPFQFVLLHEDIPEVQDHLVQTLNSHQTSEEFEARFVRQDETLINLSMHVLSVPFQDEEALVISARDITSQIHLEQTLLNRIAQQELVIEQLLDIRSNLELQVEEHRSALTSYQSRLNLIEKVMSGISDWVRVINKDYTVTYQNPSMLDAMGDIRGRTCYQSLGFQSRCPECPLESATECDTSRRIELSLGLNTYSVICSPLRNADGSIDSVIEMMQNTSEFKQLQDAMREKSEILEAVNDSVVELNQNLEEATRELAGKNQELERLNQALKSLDQLKDNFVSTVSHELRAPLTSIKGSVSMILNGMVGEVDPKISQYLTICLRNADRLIQLINDLLDLSKIESGQIKIRRNWHSLRDIAHEVVEDLTNYALDRDVTLKVDVPDDLTIWADRDRCIQVLQNLLSNALKFTESGEVIIRSKKVDARDESFLADHGGVQIEVEDTGIGIPEDEQKKIFGKFNQVDSTLTKKTGGTGLGLAICKAIVHEHGGTISVDSQVGEGSCFRVIFPDPTETNQPSPKKTKAPKRRSEVTPNPDSSHLASISSADMAGDKQ
jgi:PAS domain S-box-containing protein